MCCLKKFDEAPRPQNAGGMASHGRYGGRLQRYRFCEKVWADSQLVLKRLGEKNPEREESTRIRLLNLSFDPASRYPETYRGSSPRQPLPLQGLRVLVSDDSAESGGTAGRCLAANVEQKNISRTHKNRKRSSLPPWLLVALCFPKIAEELRKNCLFMDRGPPPNHFSRKIRIPVRGYDFSF